MPDSGGSGKLDTVMRTQLVHALLFVVSVGLLYLATAVWWFEKWRKREPVSGFSRFFARKSTGRVLNIVSFLGIICILYGFFIEPWMLTVRTHEIVTDKLPADVRIRIVHVADMHIRTFGKYEQNVIEMVKELKPDIIMHSGDFYAFSDDTEAGAIRFVSAFDVPQYFCRGNLDRLGDVDALTKATGLIELANEVQETTVNGAKLVIAGFLWGRDDAIKDIASEMPQDTFNIVLYHAPYGFAELNGTPADLMLAGHTHGGQIRLPFYGALITMDPLGKKYESGIYHEQDATLIVSRGIGCEPLVPPVRFLCRPEIVVVDLIGKE